MKTRARTKPIKEAAWEVLKRALEKMNLELGLGADVLAAQLHLDVEKIRGLSGELSIVA